jgi:SLT domain-containing protein
LFGESPEQEPPKIGTTPVEAKRELVKIALKMIGLYRALVGAEKPSLEQGRNPVNGGHGDVSGIAAVWEDGSPMRKSVFGEIVVATPTSGQHRWPMLHYITDDGHQAGTRRVRDTTHADAAETLGKEHLDSDGNHRLASRTTIPLTAVLFAANQSLIHFYLTAKAVAIRANHRCPKAV